jgi:hypothetical protein
MLEQLRTPFMDTMFGIVMIVFVSSMVSRWGWMVAGWILSMFDRDR